MQLPNGRSIKFWAVLTLILFVIGMFCVPFIRVPPIGKFKEDDISYEGLAYYDFHGGRVRLILEGTSTQDCGFYEKTRGSWMWISKQGSTNLLESTVFRLRVSDPSCNWSKQYPRLLWGSDFGRSDLDND
jgi:hypothetical protein